MEKKIIICFLNEINKFKSDVINNKFSIGDISSSDDSEDEIMEEDVTILNITSLATARDPPLRVRYYVEEIVGNYNRIQFQQNFRMSLEGFEYLLEKYCEYCKNSNLPNYSKFSWKQQLLSVIWLLSTPDSYRSVTERFGVPKSSLNKYFFRVVEFLNKIASTIIKFPSEEEKSETKNYFEEKKNIKGIIGAIDGCYIPIEAPHDQRMAYVNRKCFTSVTLQAICRHDLSFIDCFIGYPSSVHDNRIFRNSPIYSAITTNIEDYFAEGEVILGDKAYPINSWCVPPFIDRGRLTRKQKKFNKHHAGCRQTIERSFALLLGRFRRLKKLPMKGVAFVPATILAACVLHNICIKFPDDHIEEYIQQGLEDANRNLPTDAETEVEFGTRLRSMDGETIRNQMADEVWGRNNFNAT